MEVSHFDRSHQKTLDRTLSVNVIFFILWWFLFLFEEYSLGNLRKKNRQGNGQKHIWIALSRQMKNLVSHSILFRTKEGGGLIYLMYPYIRILNRFHWVIDWCHLKNEGRYSSDKCAQGVGERQGFARTKWGGQNGVAVGAGRMAERKADCDQEGASRVAMAFTKSHPFPSLTPPPNSKQMCASYRIGTGLSRPSSLTQANPGEREVSLPWGGFQMNPPPPWAGLPTGLPTPAQGFPPPAIPLPRMACASAELRWPMSSAAAPMAPASAQECL